MGMDSTKQSKLQQNHFQSRHFCWTEQKICSLLSLYQSPIAIDWENKEGLVRYKTSFFKIQIPGTQFQLLLSGIATLNYSFSYKISFLSGRDHERSMWWNSPICEQELGIGWCRNPGKYLCALQNYIQCQGVVPVSQILLLVWSILKTTTIKTRLYWFLWLLDTHTYIYI